MKNKDVVIGMKVVPTRKTIGIDGIKSLSASVQWNSVKDSSRPYLYVVQEYSAFNCWILATNDLLPQGELFKAKDFVIYHE